MRIKRMTIWVLIVVTMVLIDATQATTLTFNDGHADQSPADNAYYDIGLELEYMKFFNSSLPGHVPFFYGSDDWGITIDGGAPLRQAKMNFLVPVIYVEIDVRAQAAFDLNGVEPFQIEIVAFNPDGTIVTSYSVNFGLDIVVPRPPEDGDYPLGAVSFLLEDIGPISSVILTSERKMGIDTLRFEQVPEPSTPPVANADGPYTMNVGDTLTLDANGSTDDDNDIVSYMWDLDDNNSFETDAGGQAIFDVNFAYLQSLGLLVGNTYNIHLQVTDSESQSDTADSTLTILPKPATVVAVDIKPGSCPNPVNVRSSGVLPVAILGTEDFDVNAIVPTSVQLVGVDALRNSYEDVAAPVQDGNDCNCTTAGPDGFLDLTLKFKTQEIVEAIGEVNDGDVLPLTLTGVLFDPIPLETPIEGADCILIRGRHKPINPADINKDGVVNFADFAIFADNWLQSSIVED